MQKRVLWVLCLTWLFVDSLQAQSAGWRDSAGVRIVAVAANALAALPAWRLEGPTIRIEPDAGGVEYELHQAGSPWQLSDGRIVVANNYVELRFFDARGQYLSTVARRGRGPGEYEQLLRVFRIAGDTLLAWEFPTSRVDVRDGHGKLIRAFKVPRTFRFAGLGGPAAVFEEFQFPDLQKLGVRQDSIVLRQLHNDGTAGVVMARVPGRWIEVTRARGEGAYREVVLSGLPMLAGGAYGAVFVHGDEFAVYWFGDATRLVAISRVALPGIRVTESEKQDEARRRSAELAQTQVRVDPGQRPSPHATHLPQVTRLTVDSEGRAWLRRWSRYGSTTAEWIVFERFGAPIARISLPAMFQPNDIATDYVLGIITSEDGVQSVHKYRIVR